MFFGPQNKDPMKLPSRVVALCLLLCLGGAALAQNQPVTHPFPLVFEENHGQAAAAYQFLARGPQYNVGLTGTGTTVFLRDGSVTLRAAGANAQAVMHPEGRLPGVSNYYYGKDSAHWPTGIAQFARVIEPALYPGVDLVQYGTDGELEWDFVIHPGADAAAIAIQVTGAERIQEDASGDLSLVLHGDNVRLKRPVAYQLLGDGRRVEVPVQYRQAGAGEYRFVLGKYDRSRTLIIDPVLSFSTFLTSSAPAAQSTAATGMRADSAGNLYIVGYAIGSGYPLLSPIQGYVGTGGADLVITKMSPSGQLLFSTYLGGSMGQGPRDMALDSNGAVYIVGNTSSTNFPTTPGAFSTSCPQFCNTPFAVKINGNGTLAYSTYLGPSNANALGASTLPDGSLVIGGIVASADLPLVSPLDSTPPQICTSCSKGFLQRLAPDGGSMLFSTYFESTIGRVSATGSDFFALGQDLSMFKVSGDGQSILLRKQFAAPSAGQIVGSAIDASGGLVLTGTITGVDFPYTANAARAACVTPDLSTCTFGTVFLMRFDATGTLVYASAVAQGVVGPGLFLDSAGNVYLTGGTNMPLAPKNAIQNAVDESQDSSSDAFVVEIAPNGQTLFSTLLGGANTNEQGNSVVVDAAGRISVVGNISQTINDQVDYPLLHPVQTLSSCCTVGGMFLAQIAPTNASLLLATRLTMDNRVYQLRNLGSTGATITSLTGNVAATITSDCIGTLPGGGICTIAAHSSMQEGLTVTVQTTNAGTYAFNMLSDVPVYSHLVLTPHYSNAFAPVMVGSTGQPVTLKVRNTGPGPTGSLTTYITTGNDFQQTNNCPATLNAEASCNITVTFAPTSTGLKGTSLAVNGGSASDFAYLAGTAVNTAMTASVTALSFGTQQVGANPPARAFEIYNATNSAVGITGASATPPFTATAVNCASVAPGSSCRGTASFTPTQNGFVNGTLTFTHNGPGGTFTVPVSGLGVIDSGLALSNYDLNFGLANINTGRSSTVTMTNVSHAAITLGAITAPAAYTTSNDCPTPIAAGQSCTLTIYYQPTAPGTDNGQVWINHSGTGSPENVNVSGSARLQLDFSTPSLDFGQVVLGASSDMRWVSLGNNGPAVTVSNYSIDPQFTILQNSCGSSIPAFYGCSLQMVYTPTALGPQPGMLSVTASDYNQPHVLQLNGSGVNGTLFTITSPVGGERWVQGTTHSITWTYSGGDPGATVNLNLGTDANGPVIAAGVPVGSNGSGSYDWTIPLNTYAATNYRVRIASVAHPEYHNLNPGNFTVAVAPKITVQAPNGGDQWDRGTTQTVMWSFQGDVGTSFKIELLQSGNVVQTIALNAPANPITGMYSWAIPANLPTGNYRVRVTSNADMTVSDVSDNDFLVTMPEFLAITAPNGGEVWAAGTTQNITWQYSHNPGSLKIELLENGNAVQTIASSATLGTGGNGSFAWAIPANLTPQTDYRVRVTSTSDTTFTSTSAANFQITAPPMGLTLTSPNGSNTLTAGVTTSITWTYTGAPGSVKLELLKAGSLVQTISSSAAVGSNGSGSFSWLVPSTMALGNDYRVRITSVSTPSVTDTSDADFRINHTGFAVTSPNGGESWQVGTTQTIKWIYSGSVGTAVKIDLYKSGVLNKALISSTPVGSGGVGQYSWAVPGTQAVGSDYTVKVTSTSVTTMTDASNANFSIVNTGVALTSPNGGEVWAPGSTHNITWTSSGTPGTDLKIELLKGGVVNATLASAVAIGNGSFSWQVPANQTLGTDYTVRISSNQSPQYTDSSNANFSIDQRYTLTVNPTGTGTYSITSSPSGISCPGTCAASFSVGTPLTLTASPTNGTTFNGWSGACSGTSTCPVTMNADTSVGADFTGPPMSLTVTSPNGGNTLTAGGTTSITWSYTGAPGNVKLELLRSGSLVQTISSGAALGSNGSGSFSWLVPSTMALGNDYRIRITSVSTPSVTDTSDADFRINHTGIAVTSPNGGESWQAGTTQTIKWIYAGSVGTAVKVDLYKAGVLNKTLISATAMGSGGSGQYSWAIPAAQTVASDYTVKVTSTSLSTTTDASNASFSIVNTGVALTSPNGGEVWAPGSTHDITWSFSGNPGTDLKIELLKGGVVNATLAAAAPIGSSGTGSFSWQVPANQAIGSDYSVRITSNQNAQYTDSSNASFTVDQRFTLTVNPTGTGSYSITSSPSGITCPGTCSATFSVGTPVTLTASPANGTTFNGWSGACSGTSTCPVTMNADATVGADFTGPALGITLTSPNGGETWSRGTTHVITWTYAGSPGTAVKIDLLKAGAVVRPLSLGTSIGSNGAGSFSWFVPVLQTVGSDYTIRITSTTQTTITDTSNATFSIQ